MGIMLIWLGLLISHFDRISISQLTLNNIEVGGIGGGWGDWKRLRCLLISSTHLNYFNLSDSLRFFAFNQTTEAFVIFHHVTKSLRWKMYLRKIQDKRVETVEERAVKKIGWFDVGNDINCHKMFSIKRTKSRANKTWQKILQKLTDKHFKLSKASSSSANHTL